MTGFGNKRNQKLELTLDDVRWVYAPEPHETRGKRIDEIIGDAIIQWIHTGEIWLLTDGKKPFMVCYVTSVLSEKEAVMIHVTVLNNETLTAMADQMSRGILLTQFEILRFNAETNDISFVYELQNQKETRQRADSSFDIIFLASNALKGSSVMMSFIDIGSKADQVFEGLRSGDQKRLNNLVMKLSDLSDRWCTEFDGDRYVDQFRERVRKPIVAPTGRNEI